MNCRAQVRQSARQSLPERRPNMSGLVMWQDQTQPGLAYEFTVTVGFDAALQVREVFAADFAPDGMVRFLFEDTCVLISHLLQNGYGLAEVVGKLGRDKTASRTPMASMLAVAMELEQAMVQVGGDNR